MVYPLLQIDPAGTRTLHEAKKQQPIYVNLTDLALKF